jgi:hypothetical protein
MNAFHAEEMYQKSLIIMKKTGNLLCNADAAIKKYNPVDHDNDAR